MTGEISDLPEVVHHRDAELPEVIQQERESFMYHHDAGQKSHDKPFVDPNAALGLLTSEQNAQQPDEPLLCGIKRRRFWTVLGIVLFIILAVALGGGLGGGLSRRSEDADVPVDPTPISTRTPISYGPPATTSTAVTPSSTIYLTCPSINNTLYTATSENFTFYFNFRQICGNAYNNSYNYQSWVQTSTASLDECIQSCVEYNIVNRVLIQAGEVDICNTVCWRYTAGGGFNAGACFGFTTVNDTGFVYGGYSAGLCNSAALINQDAFINRSGIE